jgi:transcriptional regulator with XRE-family HTH domain
MGKQQTTKYNRIKVELTEAGKQNSDLATYMKVHPSTVSDWCTNTNQPSIQDLYKISEFLKTDVRRLLVPTNWATEALNQTAEREHYFTKPKTTTKRGKK